MYLDVLSKYSILDLGTTYKCIYLSVLGERYMRSRVIPEADRPLSRLQLVRTVHLANRQDGIYPLPRHLGQNLVAKVADFSTVPRSMSPVHPHRPHHYQYYLCCILSRS